MDSGIVWDRSCSGCQQRVLGVAGIRISKKCARLSSPNEFNIDQYASNLAHRQSVPRLGNFIDCAISGQLCLRYGK